LARCGAYFERVCRRVLSHRQPATPYRPDPDRLQRAPVAPGLTTRGGCPTPGWGSRMTQTLDYSTLKARQREIREGVPPPFALRIPRALSWLGRAEQESDDADVRFILLWVSCNATYAGDLEGDIGGERKAFGDFFRTLVRLDADRRIYNAVWSRFPHEIRLLLDNPYVYAPFWRHHNGAPGYGDWADRSEE